MELLSSRFDMQIKKFIAGNLGVLNGTHFSISPLLESREALTSAVSRARILCRATPTAFAVMFICAATSQ
jgi:hypothetical protein